MLATHATHPRRAFDPRTSNLGTPRTTCAFTLIELIMVLVIASVLLGVAAIRLSRGAVFMAEAERAARTLVGDLRVAQSEAMAKASNHYLVFTNGGSKYTGYTVWRSDSGGDVEVGPARQFPDSVAVTGSEPRVGFSPGGDAVTAATYTVTSPDRTYLITVTLATGAVSLEEVVK